VVFSSFNGLDDPAPSCRISQEINDPICSIIEPVEVISTFYPSLNYIEDNRDVNQSTCGATDNSSRCSMTRCSL